MNIQQIEYILAVSDLKNFGKAAEACCITQSTLSTMIGKYENEISIKIFDRATKPVSITKEGSRIIEQLKRISREIKNLNELTMSIKGEISGELTIGIIPTVAPFILPEFLYGFAQRFPEIKITVSEMTTEAIIDSLKKRELDLGIMAIPLSEDELIEQELYSETFVLYDCSHKIADAYINLEQMEFDKFWLLEEGHCLSTQVNRICDFDKKKNTQGINFEFKAGSISSLIRFVQKNKGKTLLPYLASLELTEEEKKKVSFFRSPVPVRSVGLVSHKHFAKQKILELIRSAIKKSILPLLESKQEDQNIIRPI